jgi:hypothetical protein
MFANTRWDSRALTSENSKLVSTKKPFLGQCGMNGKYKTKN